jgi:hypothetical protein
MGAGGGAGGRTVQAGRRALQINVAEAQQSHQPAKAVAVVSSGRSARGGGGFGSVLPVSSSRAQPHASSPPAPSQPRRAVSEQSPHGQRVWAAGPAPSTLASIDPPPPPSATDAKADEPGASAAMVGQPGGAADSGAEEDDGDAEVSDVLHVHSRVGSPEVGGRASGPT